MIEAKKLASESMAVNGIASIYKNKSQQNDNVGFESIFKKADENVRTKREDFTSKTKPDAYSSKRKESTEVASSSERSEKSKPRGKGTDSPKAEKSEKVSEKPTQDNPDKETKDDTKIIKMLSEELSVSEEKITEILNALNISPQELGDKTNLNNFLRELLGAEDNLELLNVPNIKEIIQTINQVLESSQNTQSQPTETHEEPVSTAASLPVDGEKSANNENPKDPTAQVLNKPGSSTVSSQEEALGKDTEAPKAKGTTGTETDAPKEAQAGQKSLAGDAGSKKDNSGANLPSRDQSYEQLIMGNTSSQAIANEKLQYTQSTAKASSSQNVNSQDVIEQIVSRMKVEVRGNVSEVRLTLRPENLGDVSLKISTENGIVTAHFIAENQRVKEVIESNFNSLKDVLQQQGIEINSLSVSVGQSQQERMMQQFRQESQQSLAKAEDIRNGTEAVDSEAEGIDAKELYDSNVDFSA